MNLNAKSAKLPARVGWFLCAVAMLGLAFGLSNLDAQRAWAPAVEKWGTMGAGGSAFLFLLLALFWPLLDDRHHAPSAARLGSPELPSNIARTEWWIPATIALLAFLLNMMRMHHPLWGDEERTVRNYVLGQYKATGAESVKWRACSWGDTLFDYQSPNNHGFYSALARLAHGDKKTGNGPQDLPFDEWRVRLPAAIASELSVFLLWWMARAFGWKTGAAAAAILFVAHPWFVRYSTEARGYGLLFLLVPLAVGLATRALATGRWRWWLALSVAQAMLFMTWMLQLHWLLALNAGILTHILGVLPKEERTRLVRRQFVSGVAATALILPLQLPAAMQLLAWMQDGKSVMPQEFLHRWVADVVSTLLVGKPWYSSDPGNVLCPGGSEAPLATLTGGILPLILMLGGTAMVIRRRDWWILLMTVFPLLPLFLQAAVKSSVLLPWYASPIWPMTALLMGAGVEKFARIRGMISPLIAMALVLATIGPWQSPAALLRSHPMEDNLTATLATRQVLNPDSPGFGRDAITVSPQLARPAYDPLARKAETIGELREILLSASTLDRPVFVHAGDPRLLAGRNPEMWEWLSDRTLFGEPREFPGMDGPQRRIVWKWTGKPPP